MQRIIIKNLIMEIVLPESEVRRKAAEMAGVSVSDLKDFKIVRRSLDARKKHEIHFNYSVEIEAELAKTALKKFEQVIEIKEEQVKEGNKAINGRPVIVGSGPCGLFCAYTLAKRGYRPLILERGSEMHERVLAFDKLKEEGILSPENNVCFGEGGAGTFSDGKLTTRIKDKKTREVIAAFIEHGASESISYVNKPHVGTDIIRKIVVSMRNEIIRLGGEYLFNTKLIDVEIKKGELSAIHCVSGRTKDKIDTNCAVLAIGHSARDTYEMLLSKGLTLVSKPFAVGVRVEHPREMIDENQYGRYAGHPALGAADYKLTADYNGRGVYSFCMCPGGEVVCSATENGKTAVNGMSYHARNARNSNSAIVVSVKREDLPSNPMGGIQFQRKIEKRAFDLAGGYGAPAMNIRDFLSGNNSKELNVLSSYKPYVKIGDYTSCLPGFVVDSLRAGFLEFDKKIRGFQDGIMLGVETRTSSPVRIVRDDGGQCEGISGLYPSGEGAGYAGGIVSAAVDGIRTAEKIIAKYRSFN